MPSIATQPVTMYQPIMPYHYLYDNLPIQGILDRMDSLNAQIDIDAQTLRNAAGNAGTLDNRLNQSLSPTGQLLVAAVDACLHNIGAHQDGSYLGVQYVRMQLTERTKLAAIASGANAMLLSLQTAAVTFNSGTVTLVDTPTIVWSNSAQNVRADLTFSRSLIHQFVIDANPVSFFVSPDYMTYKVNSLASPYVPGTLRVYINGVRLSQTATIYTPDRSATPTWTLRSYTEDSANGKFTLNAPINTTDIIRIDYDLSV